MHKILRIMRWTLAYTTASTVVQAVLTVWTVVVSVTTLVYQTSWWLAGLRQHLKNYTDHVHGTTYYVPWTT